MYLEKCFKKYKTFYNEECTQTYEHLCTTLTVTKFVDDCSTEYTDECRGYNSNCVKVPRQVCQSKPVRKQIEKCADVPSQSCRRIPFRKPEKVCKNVPSRECKNVPNVEISDQCSPYNDETCQELELCIANCLKTCKPIPVQLCENNTKYLPIKVPIRICD